MSDPVTDCRAPLSFLPAQTPTPQGLRGLLWQQQLHATKLQEVNAALQVGFAASCPLFHPFPSSSIVAGPSVQADSMGPMHPLMALVHMCPSCACCLHVAAATCLMRAKPRASHHTAGANQCKEGGAGGQGRAEDNRRRGRGRSTRVPPSVGPFEPAPCKQPLAARCAGWQYRSRGRGCAWAHISSCYSGQAAPCPALTAGAGGCTCTTRTTTTAAAAVLARPQPEGARVRGGEGREGWESRRCIGAT